MRNDFLKTFCIFAVWLVVKVWLVNSTFAAVPLLSPRHASQPKSTPMLRSVTRSGLSAPGTVPLTEPAPVMWMTVTNGINFLHCNTNDPQCQLYSMLSVSAVHPAGHELIIDFAESATSTQWAFAARFEAGTVDRISGFTWFRPEWQNPPRLFFKSRTFIPIVPTASGTVPAAFVSPAFGPFAEPWSRKR
jgi:hypothetical protein